MQRALTFDEIALVPQFNNIVSRIEPDLTTWLTRNVQVKFPVVPANMDSVMGVDLARVIIKNGGVPIFHRFAPLETQLGWVAILDGNLFVSGGLNDYDNIAVLLEAGAVGVCIDVAHGHDKRMMNLISKLKKNFPEKEVIAGNVCTAMGYQDLVNAGADAVKVGIGPGAACTTRIVTGFGVPQFTAIMNCAEVAQKLRVPIIADGGIRGSDDIVKALAAGASTVMSGKIFALTEESAAAKERRGVGGALFARYRGQASEEFQQEYKGGLKVGTVAEGTAFWGKVTGPAQKTIDDLMGGIKSGFTYGSARSIKELQRKAEFVQVNPYAYARESNPRPI